MPRPGSSDPGPRRPGTRAHPGKKIAVFGRNGAGNPLSIARIYNKSIEDAVVFVDDFAELGRQLYLPVRTYSSGMRARLAFALTLAVDFDCFLIDEVIAVGDQRFHAKCHEALFVKRHHDMAIIKEYCSQALVMAKSSTISITP